MLNREYCLLGCDTMQFGRSSSWSFQNDKMQSNMLKLNPDNGDGAGLLNPGVSEPVCSCWMQSDKNLPIFQTPAAHIFAVMRTSDLTRFNEIYCSWQLKSCMPTRSNTGSPNYKVTFIATSDIQIYNSVCHFYHNSHIQ